MSLTVCQNRMRSSLANHTGGRRKVPFRAPQPPTKALETKGLMSPTNQGGSAGCSLRFQHREAVYCSQRPQGNFSRSDSAVIKEPPAFSCRVFLIADTEQLFLGYWDFLWVIGNVHYWAAKNVNNAPQILSKGRCPVSVCVQCGTVRYLSILESLRLSELQRPVCRPNQVESLRVGFGCQYFF